LLVDNGEQHRATVGFIQWFWSSRSPQARVAWDCGDKLRRIGKVAIMVVRPKANKVIYHNPL